MMPSPRELPPKVEVERRRPASAGAEANRANATEYASSCFAGARAFMDLRIVSPWRSCRSWRYDTKTMVNVPCSGVALDPAGSRTKTTVPVPTSPRYFPELLVILNLN